MIGPGYEALKNGAIFFTRADLGVLQITGDERAAWLQGLVTADVAGLEVGQHTYGFILDLKGRILADFEVYAETEVLWLVLPRAVAAELCTHLNGRLIIEDARVSDLSSQTAFLALAGPTCAPLLPDFPGASAELMVQAVEVRAHKATPLGGDGFLLAVPPASIEPLGHALAAAGAVALTAAEHEAARLENGIPRFGADLGPHTMALEVGARDAFHWGKGCYLGQEVIARVAHRGQPNRQLRRLDFSTADVPPIGLELFPVDDPNRPKPAAVVTSAAFSPQSGAAIAFALVKRRFVATGTSLRGAGFEARVVDAPIRGHIPDSPAFDPGFSRGTRQTGLLA